MRIIDADELIYEDIKCIDGNIYMVVHAPQIDNAPTAYDFDKVVEELKTAKQKALVEYNIGEYNLDNNIGNRISENYRKDMNEGKCFAYDEAIEIVNHGGVSDDVCEWKKHRIIDDVQMYDSSCLHEFEERCAKKYKYCPYCSKKIKVVK